MKKMFKNLAVLALVLGVCSFNAVKGVPCDHEHDATCGYNTETETGCTHTHGNPIAPCDNGEGPLG